MTKLQKKWKEMRSDYIEMWGGAELMFSENQSENLFHVATAVKPMQRK